MPRQLPLGAHCWGPQLQQQQQGRLCGRLCGLGLQPDELGWQ